MQVRNRVRIVYRHVVELTKITTRLPCAVLLWHHVEPRAPWRARPPTDACRTHHLKVLLSNLQFSGVKCLGGISIRGPVVRMWHWTLCLRVFTSVTSGNSSKSCRAVFSKLFNTLTPLTVGPLGPEENCVAVPECKRRLLARSRVMPNRCKKSIPNIGREIFANIN